MPPTQQEQQIATKKNMLREEIVIKGGSDSLCMYARQCLIGLANTRHAAQLWAVKPTDQCPESPVSAQPRARGDGQWTESKGQSLYAMGMQQRAKGEADSHQAKGKSCWACGPVGRRQQTAGLTVETCLCSSDAFRHVVCCILEEWVIQQLGTGWPLGRVSLYTCLQRRRKPGFMHEHSKAAKVVYKATCSGGHAFLQLRSGMSRLHACRSALSRSNCSHYI